MAQLNQSGHLEEGAFAHADLLACLLQAGQPTGNVSAKQLALLQHIRVELLQAVQPIGNVSAEKLALLQHTCTEFGVHTTPQCLEGVWIVPLYSWYHASFDQEPDVPNAIPANKVSGPFSSKFFFYIY